MSIAATVKATVEPIWPSPPEEQQRVMPVSTWFGVIEDTGDATGGSVNLNVSFKAAAQIFPFYVTLHTLWVTSTDTTAGNSSMLRIRQDEWEIVDALTANAVMVFHLPQNIATQNALELSRLQLPLYLGKPKLSNSGLIRLDFEANTDTKLYSTRMAGFLWQKKPRWII